MSKSITLDYSLLMPVKKIIFIIIALLILIAIPLSVFLVKQQQDIRQRAAPGTTLYFDPATNSANPDQTVSVNIMIDTGENQVTQIDLDLTYDPTYLEAIDIENGTFLENIVKSGTVGEGEASISLGTLPTTPKTGNGLVATISFKTLSPTSSTVLRFGANTRVQPLGDTVGDVLVGTQPATFSIGSAQETGKSSFEISTISASPSPLPSASPADTTTTRITSPVSGSTLATNRPTFQGISFPSALILLSIDTTPIISTTLHSNTSGNWSYTPQTSLSPGTYVVTVSAENQSTGATETATSTFTISGQASPSTTPAPSSSVSPSSTPLTSTTPELTSEVPVTGNTSFTLLLFGLSFILVSFSLVSWVKK